MERVRQRFTIAEQYWDLGERRLPTNMQFDIRLTGRLDTDRVRDALAAAIAVHPMARARRVVPRRRTRPSQWEIGAASEVDVRDVVRVVRCATEDDLLAARDAFFNEVIDIGRAPAIRALHVTGAGSDALLISMHHAICDGIGALHFLRSLARAYAGEPDPPSPVDAVEVRYLAFRSRAKRARRRRNSRRLRGVPLSFAAPSGATTTPGYGLSDYALSIEETARLNPRRWGEGITINDLLLAAVNLAIDRWNSQHGQPSQRIAITMPLSLRPAEWRDQVMANLVTLGKVSTTPEERVSLPALLAAITAQTRRLKESGPFVAATLPVWAQRIVVLLLPLVTRRVRTSAVVSNLGRLANPPDFGSQAGTISNIWISGPIGVPPGLSIVAVTVHDRLHFSLRYRTDFFDAPAAGRFIAILVDQLRALSDDALPVSDLGHRAERALVTETAPQS